MGRPLGVLLFVSVVRHAVPIMTRRRPCCRFARVGRDWVCDARGTGIQTVVQTNTANGLAGLGWVCCAVLLVLVLLLHDEGTGQASSFPSHLARILHTALCLAAAGAADLRARKGLLYVREFVRAHYCLRWG